MNTWHGFLIDNQDLTLRELMGTDLNRKAVEEVKRWTIDEFVSECEVLCRNQYTYDYSRMPEGVCNGHHVKPYMDAWHSIVIDGFIDTLTAITDEHPDGYVQWQEDGRMMTALEHLRYVLSK